MEFKNLKTESKETIKILTYSGILIVIFYLLVSHVPTILALLSKVISVLAPFIFGAVFTLVLLPIRRVVENEILGVTKLKDRTKRRIAVSVCLIVFILVVFAFFALLVPQLVDSLGMFIDSFDGYVTTIRNFIDGIDLINGNNEYVSNMLNSLITMAGERLTDWLTGAQGGLSRVLSASISIFKGIFNFLVGIVIAVYILLDSEKFTRQTKSLIYVMMEEDKADRIANITKLTLKTFNSFISGKFVDSLIIGIITYFVALIIKWPYAPLIAVVIGVTNMIPVFGPFIGAVPSILILLIIKPLYALEFGIFIVILQQIDGNIIGPKILGEAVGLPTLWVMFAIIVGGALFGAVGMFVGVPIFSVIYVLVGEVISDHLERKKIDLETTKEMRMRL